jgi:hypothetical protein
VRRHNLGFAVALVGAVAFAAAVGIVTVTGARLMSPPEGAMRHAVVAAVPVRGDRVRAGDLLVFTAPDGEPVMRRVQWVGPATVRTSGPWTIDADRSALRRVTLVIPYLGYLTQAAHSTVAWSAGAVVWPLGMLLAAAVVLSSRSRRDVPDAADRPLSLMDEEFEKQPN